MAFRQATVKGIYRFVYQNFEARANWFTWLRCILERDIFRPTVFINVENTEIYMQIFKFELVCMDWRPFYVDKMCYIFVLFTFEIQPWILQRKWLLNTLHDYWVFMDSLESVAEKKTLFYMNASTIKALMWMNQVNATIISLVIAYLFQMFSFHNLSCNKHYAAFT